MSDIDHKTAMFLHTKTRVRERYKFYIDEVTYADWIAQIKDGRASFIKSVPEGILYRVDYNFRDIFVVYMNDVICTAMPYKVEWAQKARNGDKRLALRNLDNR